MKRSSRRFGVVAGAVILAVLGIGAAAASAVAPHDPDMQFEGLLNAPPTVVHIIGADGRLRAPFIHPWVRVNQLEQRYEPDITEVPLAWFAGGRILSSTDDRRAPLLPLGADSFGRDVLSRVLFGARLSLGLSFMAALAAVVLGAAIGGFAGYAGGTADELLMRATDFVIVLPAMYVILALRAALPLALTSTAVFELLLIIFAVLGAPTVAKGVRAIIRAERHQEYAIAARSLGAGASRLLFRHLLPSASGFLIVQLTLLVPAFVIAEATLSFVGLGFPDPVPSWGIMLHEASNLRALSDFPWLLSPAVAMFLIVLSLNVLLQRDALTSINRT